MAGASSLTAGLGFGTMEHVDGSHGPEAMYEAVLAYLKAGGRSLDCAEVYLTTPHVGRAIADSGIDRSEIHVTTKLSGLPINCGNFHGSPSYEAVVARLETHLRALGLSYVDLLLIHWPGPAASPDAPSTESFVPEHSIDLLSDPEMLAKCCTWAYFDEHIDAAWDNLRALQDAGLCTRIGVSNFNAAHLARLVRGGKPAPFANQIMIDANCQQQRLVDEMQSNGILPIAYRALAFLPAVAMAAEMGDGTHAALSALKDRLRAASLPQVVLAWLMRRGVHVLFKTADEARLADNLMASALAEAPEWGGPGQGAPDEATVLRELDGSELVAALGGDECARVFMAMGN